MAGRSPALGDIDVLITDSGVSADAVAALAAADVDVVIV